MTNHVFLACIGIVALLFGVACGIAIVQEERETARRKRAKRGGKGKRSTSAATAQRLHEAGHKVQVVDLDTGEVYETQEKSAC